MPLRIDLTPLREGAHHVVLHPEAEALGLNPERFADIQVDAVLDAHNDRVLVTLQATAQATLECDRTLALFQQAIEGSHRILFVPPSFARRDDEAYEDVRVLEPSDREIDLAEAVRDTLLLAVPARKVAPGAEDADIPSVFGAPDDAGLPAIDPRWEALRALHPDENSSDA